MKVATYSGILVDSVIWLSNIMSNGLYRLNPSNGKVDFACCFSTNDKFAQYQHKKVLRYKDKLIFVPLLSEYINIIGLHDNIQESIKLFDDKEEKISDAFIVDNQLILFPLHTDTPLIRVNLLNHEIKYDWEFIDVLMNYRKRGDVCISKCQYLSNENSVEFVIYGTSFFARYDLKTHDLVVKDIKIANLYMSYRRDDDRVIFLNNDSPIVSVMGSDNKVNSFKMTLEGYKEGKRPFNGVIDYDGRTYIYPAYSDSLLKLDCDGKCESISVVFNDNEIINPAMPKFFGYTEESGKVWLLPFQSEQLYVMDGNKLSKLNVEENYSIEHMHVLDVQTFDENDILGLSLYINALCCD